MAKHPGGRPLITIQDLRPDWKEAILTEMAEGASLTEIDVLLGISKDTRLRLIKDNQEFSDTINVGRASSKAWWLKAGRKNLMNKEFSPTLWYMNMKNRFFWTDRRDVTTKGDKIEPGAIIDTQGL
jgi:hypothetical protein